MDSQAMNHGYLTREYSGGCQCGAVRYQARRLRANPHFCHCRMCQKAVGNLFGAWVGVNHADFAWTRGAPATFRSSGKTMRGFCSNCGTPLSVEDDGSTYLCVTIGSLDTPQVVPILSEIGLEGHHPSLPPVPSATQRGATEEDDAEWAAAIARTNNQHPDHDTEHWEPRHG
jgi:hypothetical protein